MEKEGATANFSELLFYRSKNVLDKLKDTLIFSWTKSHLRLTNFISAIQAHI